MPRDIRPRTDDGDRLAPMSTRTALVAVGLLAAAVAAALLLRDSGDRANVTTQSPPTGFAAAELPEVRETDVQRAARAAGCVLTSPSLEGAEHTDAPVRYRSNPPTSGDHAQVPADDGAYPPGTRPPLTATVHSLEHGRINVQWSPGLSAEAIGQLKAVFDERSGYHLLLFENQTDMPYEVAATAWGRSLACDEYSPRAIDAIRAFIERYTDKGPEFVP